MVKDWWKVSADDGYRESRHAKYLSSAAEMMMSTGRIMLQSVLQDYPFAAFSLAAFGEKILADVSLGSMDVAGEPVIREIKMS
jgi:hypothetical protein